MINPFSRPRENYVEKLEPYQIELNIAHWCMRHARRYIKTYPDQRLVTHTPQIPEQYLQEKGRKKQVYCCPYRETM